MEISYDDATKPRSDDAASASADREEKKRQFLENMRKKREANAAVSGVKVFKPAIATGRAKIPPALEEGTGEFAGINEFIAQLPSNYNFEIKKCVNRIRENKVQVAALQMPEGLLLYACLIADILERYGGAQIVIMGDVTYGACCVDDLTAKALGADLLIHYGHSCLINIADTAISVLYVFVDIRFDVSHLVETVRFNFTREKRLAMVGTIQFASSFHEAKRLLEPHFDSLYIPQAKPLSGGELLGCTSPKLDANTDAIVYVADGRFHLESIMIANPGVPAYKYDPHSKLFSIEKYDNEKMLAIRKQEMEKCRNASIVGLILGTLGRQGSLSIFERLQNILEQNNRQVVVILLSEITPGKLNELPQVECWVQVACPRLSIDWGYAFSKPLLNSYEAFVCFGEQQWLDVYPQDYYSRTNNGPWTNYYGK